MEIQSRTHSQCFLFLDSCWAFQSKSLINSLQVILFWWCCSPNLFQLILPTCTTTSCDKKMHFSTISVFKEKSTKCDVKMVLPFYIYHNGSHQGIKANRKSDICQDTKSALWSDSFMHGSGEQISLSVKNKKHTNRNKLDSRLGVNI